MRCPAFAFSTPWPLLTIRNQHIQQTNPLNTDALTAAIDHVDRSSAAASAAIKSLGQGLVGAAGGLNLGAGSLREKIQALRDAKNEAVAGQVEQLVGAASALAGAAGAATADAVSTAGLAAELIKRRVQGAFGVYTTKEGLVKAQVRGGGGGGSSCLCCPCSQPYTHLVPAPTSRRLSAPHLLISSPSRHPLILQQVDTLVASQVEKTTALINAAIASLESIKAGKGPLKAKGVELTEVRMRADGWMDGGFVRVPSPRLLAALGVLSWLQGGRAPPPAARKRRTLSHTTARQPRPTATTTTTQAKLKTFAAALERVAAAAQAAPAPSQLLLGSFKFGQNAYASAVSDMLAKASELNSKLGLGALPRVAQFAG